MGLTMDDNRLCPSHSNQGMRQQLFAIKGAEKERHNDNAGYILFNLNTLNIYKLRDLSLLLPSLKNERPLHPSRSSGSCHKGEGTKDVPDEYAWLFPGN